ncbi:MAG: ABC transporter ATP-binding protein [Dehalococcoidia bacterium]|nr:ABC transporter ATP-binding protein [Dehalococcoidia bacterium]
MMKAPQAARTAPTPGAGTLLEVQDLAVEFHARRGIVKAVDGVSFTLEAGERLAIVGESGSGKSVMSMSLLQLVAHPGRIVRGSAMLNGKDLLALQGKALRDVRGADVTMVFQDPMTALNPVLRVADQVMAPLRRHLGLGPEEARRRAVESLTRVGIPDAERNLDAYPHELSGGMRQRVLIAMAVACEPRLLIADEPTTALDVTIQAQIVELLRGISDQLGTAVMFVTHDMGLVARFAHRVAVMYAGRIVEVGPVREIFANPRHPYTRGLLASIPAIDGEKPERLLQIDGTPPDLAALPAGCAFAARCPVAVGHCTVERPPLARLEPNHSAACWRASATTAPEVIHA